MNYRILCLIALFLLVGVVSADTLIVYLSEDTADMRIAENTPNAIWSTMRNAAGDLAADGNSASGGQITFYTTTTTEQYDEMYRLAYGFNTSAIPDDATITGTVFSVYPIVKAKGVGEQDVGITGFAPATPNNFVAGDYDSFGNVRYATDVAYASIPSNTAYLNYTWNAAGIANVSKTGYTNFMLRFNADIDNSNATLTWASAAITLLRVNDYTDTVAKQPLMTITYTAGGDTTPPASITGLSGNVIDCHSINWTWINPTDADYRNLIIYKNNVFLKNVTNTTTSDLWTGLTGATPYTFSSQTCDLSYNCNQTWVNSTVTTSVCPPFSVSFTSNVTCGNVPFDVQFNDTTTGLPLSWSWLFGDGNTSILQNPVFRYNITGLYTVNHTANNTFSSGSSNITGYMRAINPWEICPPTPTTPPPWTPDINPTTDTGTFSWTEWLVSMWWLWLLLVLGLILVKK